MIYKNAVRSQKFRTISTYMPLVTSNFNSSVMRPQDPNINFYFLSDGPTPVYFSIMCQLQIQATYGSIQTLFALNGSIRVSGSRRYQQNQRVKEPTRSDYQSSISSISSSLLYSMLRENKISCEIRCWVICNTSDTNR